MIFINILNALRNSFVLNKQILIDITHFFVTSIV